MNPIRKFLRLLGPGVVTGAADNDPSGIATYSQTGAQFGYGQLWLAVFMLPLLSSVQEACARIGAITGKGLAGVIKEHYSPKVLYRVVVLVLIANTINIGADIGAMAAAANLILPMPFVVLAMGFTILVLALEIYIPYRIYANVLKWLCLFLFAYPLTVFMIDVPWKEVLTATFLPHIELNYKFIFIITGVLGTTITPYLFFWQASQVVEEGREKHGNERGAVHKVDWRIVKKIRIDNFCGMFFSEICTWSIIVVTATVLHTHGITDIKTSADAAKALEPFAGYLSKLVFAVGIIGLGLLAVPVLAGSSAYALCEAVGWKNGLDLKLKQARGFYGVIIASTLIGLALNFIGIDPIQALIYAAVINGIVAVPLIFLMALIANNKKIMGEYRSRRLSNTFIWITFVGMSVTAIALAVTFFQGSH